jgi:hypothetical protein
MKQIAPLLLLILFTSFAATAQHSLRKRWSTDTTLATPESVLFDAQNKILYVSLINGQPDQADGKGGIAKVNLDGKVLDTNWVTGLNAPKGLGEYGNTLYAADLNEVVVIDIPSGKVTKKIPVEGAQFLNDITVDTKGNVYVSDTRTGKVHKIENGTVTTYLENLKNPNGLLALGNDLYVLASGVLYKADAGKKLTTIAEGMDASTDGVEQVKPGEYIVSCWNGVVYYVKDDGNKQQLLDTRADKINSADIGYDAGNKIVYVPTFFKKGVVSYQLQ